MAQSEAIINKINIYYKTMDGWVSAELRQKTENGWKIAEPKVKTTEGWK